jgi:hypothetical protein
MPDDVAAVISKITVSYSETIDGNGQFHKLKNIKLEFCDKLVALNQLANMMGLNNGGATTVINNNVLNQMVVKWDELYKKQASMASQIAALPAESAQVLIQVDTNDPIEARILAEENDPNMCAQSMSPLKVVDSNELETKHE